jgi:inosine-uridine nucleoside N-ribohydrolase
LRLWIDTDLGTDVDDALALAYALKHREIELVGVSTVFGDVELRSQMANELLRIAGRPEVPVLTGLGKPISHGRNGLMFGHEGVGLLENPAPRSQTVSDPNPEERIDAIALELSRSGADAMVAIGPMTNLGALSQLGVDLPPLTIMGGKIEEVELPGTHPSIAEWNWYCDPEAVRLTLGAPHEVPPRIVPIEVTIATALEEVDLDALAAGNELTRAVAILSRVWLRVLGEKFGAKHPKVALHDPLAIATLLRADLCPFEEREIRVDEKGFTHREADGAKVRAAIDVDREALRGHLMETWLASDR